MGTQKSSSNSHITEQLPKPCLGLSPCALIIRTTTLWPLFFFFNHTEVVPAFKDIPYFKDMEDQVTEQKLAFLKLGWFSQNCSITALGKQGHLG